ncbi:hypothetical protein Hdeb2414_s0015g00449401 [Helianthus debilis subsp. tardiflorus]
MQTWHTFVYKMVFNNPSLAVFFNRLNSFFIAISEICLMGGYTFERQYCTYEHN